MTRLAIFWTDELTESRQDENTHDCIIIIYESGSTVRGSSFECSQYRSWNSYWVQWYRCPSAWCVRSNFEYFEYRHLSDGYYLLHHSSCNIHQCCQWCVWPWETPQEKRGRLYCYFVDSMSFVCRYNPKCQSRRRTFQSRKFLFSTPATIVRTFRHSVYTRLPAYSGGGISISSMKLTLVSCIWLFVEILLFDVSCSRKIDIIETRVRREGTLLWRRSSSGVGCVEGPAAERRQSG